MERARSHGARRDESPRIRAREGRLEPAPHEPTSRADHMRRLEADRRRLSSLFHHAPVALIAVDPLGRVEDVNLSALRLLQAGPGEVLGRVLEEHVAREDRGRLGAWLAAVFHGRIPCRTEITFARPPGPMSFVAHLESAPVSDERGRRTCVLAVTDATERTRAGLETAGRVQHAQAVERDLAAVQRRFDRVVAASAQLAEDLDLDAAVARAAEVAVAGVSTYAAVDLIDADGHVRRAAFAHAGGDRDDLPIDVHAPRGPAMVCRTERPVVALSARLGDLLGLTGDPAALRVLRERVASYVCVPLRAHGRTLGAMSFARSREPLFTEEDLVLVLELARHAALAIDNARLYREAQEADEHKDEFLAMLGHELRNPLAAVVLAARALQLRVDADPAARRSADIIARQSGRLARLVDDLLDVSRVTRGKIGVRLESIALQDVVVRAVESTRPLLESRGHALRVTAPEEPLVLEGDPTRLEQVVVNLLANAARYTEPGGSVAVEVRRAGQEIAVRVADTGIGIAEEALPLIFAPFTQIDASPDRTDRGLGIGLTMARALVELHGGRIEAHSAGLGAGSEFVVWLPAPEGPVPASVPGAPESGPRAAAPRKRVLVAEDNVDLAQLLGERIEALGQEVRVTNDGHEAVEAALAFHPEVLLIDIGLPGLTGYEVAERLRREPSLTGATLVAVTGYGGVETTNRCLAAGFDEHFTKPIREEALQGLFARG